MTFSMMNDPQHKDTKHNNTHNDDIQHKGTRKKDI